MGVPPRTAMGIVGHSTVEMTMTVYRQDDQRAALDRFCEVLGREPAE